MNATNPYLSRHPVNQTKEYTDALISNHSNVVNGQLSISGCQYLHESGIRAVFLDSVRGQHDNTIYW